MGKQNKQDKRPRIESDDSMNKTQESEDLQKVNMNTGSIIDQVLTSERFQNIVAQIEWQEDRIKALEEENKSLRKRIAVIEGSVTRTELTTNKLEERVVDLATRSMRDNIIVKNVTEANGETSQDLEKKVVAIFKDVLKVKTDDLAQIKIERIHRVGKQVNGRSRNVVVKINPKGKDIVIQHIKNIPKDHKIRVTDQLPPETHAKREKLWPLFIEAKREGKQAKWRQDTLHIDGRPVRLSVDRNNDINLDTTEAAMKMTVRHTSIQSRDNTHFQGHIVDLASKDDVIPALKALRSDSRVAGATHCIYAYRVGTERLNTHNWEDDAEWGGGRCVMETIQKHNVYNKLICITQWCGARRLGQVRFDIIKELSESTLNI